MICRRCGMESSTTDKCEWCKKPMLPPGGAISMKAKEELLKQKEAAASHPEEQAAPPETRETEEEAAMRRPEAKPPPPPPEVHASGLLTLGANLGAEPEAPSETPNYVAGGESKNDEILRPLGSAPTGPEQEAKDTPLYIGNDENVLRPIERPAGKDGTKYTIDSSGRKRRVVDNTPEVPEKTRMMRGARQGAIVSVLLASIEFIVKSEMPTKFVVIPIKSYDSFIGALMYGAIGAVFFGFMLSALLVQRKWGPVAGFMVGTFLLGYMAMINSPNMPWSMINGAICGILAGKASVKGLKRVVNV